jgi:hypothetical protein
MSNLAIERAAALSPRLRRIDYKPFMKHAAVMAITGRREGWTVKE